jgi:trk system potassium uptake protein TrkA
MRIIVAGGGNLGLQVAERLEADGHEVTIVELSAARASKLHRPGLTIVRGDAAVAEILQAAGALRAEVLVACTANDEENLLISLVAKRRFAIGRVVALVNHAESSWLFDETWGVDAAVSPTAAILSMIEHESTPDEPGAASLAAGRRDAP